MAGAVEGDAGDIFVGLDAQLRVSWCQHVIQARMFARFLFGL